jgi:hypothetical protein
MSDGYRAAIAAALAAKTDVLGERALAAPDGPTYDNVHGALGPLMHTLAPAAKGSYLTDSHVHYLPFGLLDELDSRGSIALHVADGSQIISNVYDGPSLRIFLGADGCERFGESLGALETPSLLERHLPVLETEYHDRAGVRYRQESFVAAIPGDQGDLASYVRITVRRQGESSRPVRVRLIESGRTPLTRDGDRLVDEGGKLVLCFSPGATYTDGDLVYELDVECEQVIHLVRLIDASAVADVPTADASGHDSARARSIDYWRQRLEDGILFHVPEARVMDAQRALLVQNLLMTWRYSLGNQYEAFYQSESSDTVGVLGAYGHLDVYRASLISLLPKSKGPRRRNQEQGEKLTHAADYYHLTKDRDFIEANTAVYEGYAADYAVRHAADPHGLLGRQRYSSDINEDVYGLHHAALAVKGMMSIVAVWEEIGRVDLADRYRPIARSMRAALRTAVDASSRTLPDGSLFTPVQLLDDVAPYDAISSTKLGGYWNLVSWYAFAAGVYAPGSPEANATCEYLYRHGGRLLGMLRARDSAVNNVYGLAMVNFLADNDQPDQLVLTFYGRLAAGMTEGTCVAGESDNIGPIATKWPLQTGWSEIGGPFTPPSVAEGWEPDEHYRASYLAPNSANNAMFLNTLRQMLVHQVEDAESRPAGLELAFATPRGWLAHGNEISVEGAPTWFGPLSYRIRSMLDAGEVKASVAPLDRAPSTLRLRLRLPGGRVLREVAVNGRPHQAVDLAAGTLDLSGLTGDIEIQARVV